MVTQSAYSWTLPQISPSSLRLWQSLGSPTMQETSQLATGVCGGLIKLMGQLKCCVSFRGTTITAICYFTKPDPYLLGLSIELALAHMPLRVVSSRVSIAAVLAGQVKDILPLFARMFQTVVVAHTLKSCWICLLEVKIVPPKATSPIYSLVTCRGETEASRGSGSSSSCILLHLDAPIVVLKKPNGSIRICLTSPPILMLDAELLSTVGSG
ncbi:hypothetical protein SprV_0502029700 [Sparganum proliferum]